MINVLRTIVAHATGRARVLPLQCRDWLHLFYFVDEEITTRETFGERLAADVTQYDYMTVACDKL
jgi:hypothetical protein